MTMIDYTLIALFSSISVNCVLAVLYGIRIKIEMKQILIMEENAESKKILQMLQKHIKTEKEEICNMSKDELRDFLEELAGEK